MPEIGPSDIWFDPRQILPAAKNALMYPVTHPTQTAEFGLSMAPGSGEAMSAVDAWNASGRAGNALLSGNYGQAAGEYGNVLLGALGALPGAGVIARGTKRGAAWMDRNLPSGVNRLLDSAIPSDPQNTMFAIPGWHGSPHDYPAERLVKRPDGTTEYLVGKPDVLPDIPQGHELVQDFPLGRMRMDKIGTGEGAQAYGHGLYYAENPDVAVSYRNNLTKGRSEIALDGVPLNDTPQTFVKTIDKLEAEGNWPLAKAINEVQSLMRPGEDLQTVLRDRRNWHANSPKMLAAFDEFERRAAAKAPPPGRLYHTELDVEPHDLLDWDKPLSEQSDKVRNALSQLGIEAKHGYAAYQELGGKLSGNRFSEGDSAQVSQALREAGIPGIKYLDQGSRTMANTKVEKVSSGFRVKDDSDIGSRTFYTQQEAQEYADKLNSKGTSNYVIFDDKLVKVLKKE